MSLDDGDSTVITKFKPRTRLHSNTSKKHSIIQHCVVPFFFLLFHSVTRVLPLFMLTETRKASYICRHITRYTCTSSAKVLHWVGRGRCSPYFRTNHFVNLSRFYATTRKYERGPILQVSVKQNSTTPGSKVGFSATQNFRTPSETRFGEEEIAFHPTK